MTHNASFETSSNPLWEELHTRLQKTQIHYIRPSGPEDCDWDSFRRRWDALNIVSVSDWNVSDNIKLANDTNVEFTEDVVHPDAECPFDGLLDWKVIRDVLITIHGWDVDSFENQAGKAAGSLIRFTDDMERGTSIVADFSDGLALGSVIGPCLYDPEHDITEIAASHHFIREVHWARKSDGELITLPYNCFPRAIYSKSQSITCVDASKQFFQLVYAIGLLLGGVRKT